MSAQKAAFSGQEGLSNTIVNMEAPFPHPKMYKARQNAFFGQEVPKIRKWDPQVPLPPSTRGANCPSTSLVRRRQM